MNRVKNILPSKIFNLKNTQNLTPKVISILILSLLISTNQLAFAAPEVITIYGCNEGSHSNDTNTCSCDAGWSTIGIDDHDNVECEKTNTDNDDDDITNPDDPSEPDRPGGGFVPKKPTLKQCTNDSQNCVDEASNIVDDCVKEKNRFYTRELSSNRPCFGQSVETLLDGFTYNTIGPFGEVPCKPSDLWQTGSKRNCTVHYMRRGLGRCKNGQEKRHTSQTTGYGASGSITVPTYTSQVNSSKTVTLTVSSEPGIGYNQTCQQLGIKALAECSKSYQSCKNLAKNESELRAQPSKVAADYITRINKQLLGFPIQTNGISRTINQPLERLGPSGPFKSLERGKLESRAIYIERLKFLADWSEFLVREGLNDTKKDEFHNIFITIQGDIKQASDFYNNLLTAISIDNVTSSQTQKTKQLQNVLKTFISNGGLSRAQKSADNKLKIKINGLVNERVSKAFYKTFWPGITHFGYVNPMNTRHGSNILLRLE